MFKGTLTRRAKFATFLLMIPALLLASITAQGNQVSNDFSTPLVANTEKQQLEPTLWDQLQLHGFASQAVVHTSDNRWFGDSPNTAFDFTEVGLNGSLLANPRLLFAAQVLYRRAGEMYENDFSLDYGLVDITPFSSAAGRAGLRFGRIKNPLGIYNETRDVPFTHPGIFLPQVVYFDRVRNLVLSTDGAMFYGESYSRYGTFSATFGGGLAVLDDNVEWAYFSNDYAGDIENNGISWLASLWYKDTSERLKFGLSGILLSIEFDPQTTSLPTLDPGHTDIDFWIASAQYSGEKWTLTGEYAWEPIHWRDYGSLFPDREITYEGWYLQGTYLLFPEVQLMLRYEEGYADKDDRDGSKFSASTGGLLPANLNFSKILSTGIRWDINRHWMVRAEYSYNDGTFILSSRENPNLADRASYWNLFSIQVAFRF
jgi:hypothetical protein